MVSRHTMFRLPVPVQEDVVRFLYHLRLLDLARQRVEVALDNLPGDIAEQLAWELAEYLEWGPGYLDDDEENFL